MNRIKTTFLLTCLTLLLIALASALRKLQMGVQSVPMREATPATSQMFIVNLLTGASLFKLFSTHPPMEERIARLEALNCR